MTHWLVDFDAPRYLVLLAVLPLFWLVGRRSLQALGPWQRRAALGLRLVVATLLIAALAEPNWLTLARRLTVLFLVDGSSSIGRDELAGVLDYVNAAVAQRNTLRGDRAGVVAFGREARTEIPPIDAPWQLGRIESDIDPRFTNLAAALQTAAAAFPPDSANRVVIVSDGNENVGDAASQAARLLHNGIGIDVVPITYRRERDVVVETLVAPSDVRRGTPFELRVVVNNLAIDRAAGGKIRITRTLGEKEDVVAEEPVVLEPGKRVLTVRQELAESGLATYEAAFIPDQRADDSRLENNTATAFSRVSGRGRVLVIEDALQAGRFELLAELLRTHDMDVVVRDTRRPFASLADLQQFDAVILADVPRISGEGASELTQFSDAQIHMLVQNTENFGCGLIVLGGPNSYGAGGWSNTALERAMPVDFQIDDAKVEAVGALVLVVDSSGSMTGEKIAWSKAAAAAAAGMLGRRDYIGVVSFNAEAHWVVPMGRSGGSGQTRARIGSIAAGGGTDLMLALTQAYDAIRGTDASIKHVIVLTDGQTPPASYAQLAAQVQREGITTTGVAIGPDADRALLARIARAGGGKFYHVESPQAVPRVFMRQARRVAMPLVFEDRHGIAVEIASRGEVLSGIDEPLPPITGYVLTTVKQSPLVEVLLATPRQPPANGTILATWTYGLGRAAALTTDLGERWSTAWLAWGGRDKLLLQLVRWSMRGSEPSDLFAISTDVRDGAIRVVVSALDPDGARTNALQLAGTAVQPAGTARSFELEQTAPGRYVGQLEADEPGNYYLAVSGSGMAPLRTAVHVAPTAEYDRLVSNDQMLAQLAGQAPAGGEPGTVISSPQGIADVAGLTQTDVFRPGVPPARHRDAVWPLVVLAAAVLFVGDVACRRVRMSVAWLRWSSRGSAAEDAEDVRLERLKQTKARAAARWRTNESAADVVPTAVGDTAQDASKISPQAMEPAKSDSGEDAASASYTARLLEAKRRAREEAARRDKPARPP